MTNVLRTALTLFLVTSIPLSIAFYRYTPRPMYVDKAAEVVMEHNDQSIDVIDSRSPSEVVIENRQYAAAKVISTLPMVYSISAACIFAWCAVLLLGCVAAHIATSHRKRTLTPYQRLLLSGTVVLLCVNTAVIFVGSAIFHGMMDTVVMWNMGMMVVLTYLSLGMSQSGMFRCLRHWRTLWVRRQALKRRGGRRVRRPRQ